MTPPHQAAADGDLGINTPAISTPTFSLLVNISRGRDDLTPAIGRRAAVHRPMMVRITTPRATALSASAVTAP